MKRLLLILLLLPLAAYATPPEALSNFKLSLGTGTTDGVLVYNHTNDRLEFATLSGLTLTGTTTLTLTATAGGATDFVGSGAGHAHGLVPDPGATAGTTKFLREDATWQVPAGGAFTAPTGTGFMHVTGGAMDIAAVAETGTGNAVRATSPSITDARLFQLSNTTTSVYGVRFSDTTPGTQTGLLLGLIDSTQTNFIYKIGAAGQTVLNLGANNLTGLQINRFTNTTPTGNFLDFRGATGTSLFTVDITGAWTNPSFTAVTTGNVSTTAHGLVPTLDNNTSHFLNGQGGWTTPAASDVGLGSVTNDAQTKAAIVPNTVPASGQILVGNTGGTAYAPVTVSGSGATITLANTGVMTIGSIPYSSITATTSANWQTRVSDENGTGAMLFSGATTPDFTTGITIGGAAASRKVLVGDGTKFAASTETYAVPGTSGNVMTSNGTNWTSAVPIVTDTSTTTLTNKMLTPRVVTSATGNTTPTPNADTTDVYVATGMTVNMAFGAPTGSGIVDGQKLIIRIQGTAARTLSFATGSSGNYRFSSDLPVPSTTITTKTLYMGFIYNATDSRWDNIAQLNNF